MFPYYLYFDTTPPVTTYTWKKYNVVNQYESTSESASDFYGANSTIKVASSYSLNSSTGKYSLTNAVAKRINTNKDTIVSSYPYSFLTSLDTQSGSEPMYRLDSYQTNSSAPDSTSWNGRMYDVHLVQHQGTYIEDVTSTNRSAYPDNGISGDYWYVFQS